MQSFVPSSPAQLSRRGNVIGSCTCGMTMMEVMGDKMFRLGDDVPHTCPKPTAPAPRTFRRRGYSPRFQVVRNSTPYGSESRGYAFDRSGEPSRVW